MKKALILDLDNTIYPVSSILGNLFSEIFSLIDVADYLSEQVKLNAKDELTRRPYHLVADKYNFSDELKEYGHDLLKEITYNQPMQPFGEYEYIRSSALIKFLVTIGFTKLQWSKVKMLDIEKDFAEIHIVDPELSTRTKKDVFADILKRHHLSSSEVLVIGDDPESEIKAAMELGIDTFLYDPEHRHPDVPATFKSLSLKDALDLLY